MPTSRTVGPTIHHRISRRFSKRANSSFQQRLNALFDLIEQDIDQVEVDLTVAQMLALNTPLQIVAGVADTFHEYVSAVFRYKYGETEAFTIDDAGDRLVFQHGSGGVEMSPQFDPTGLLDQIVDETRLIPAVSTPLVVAPNTGIFLANTGSDLTDGADNEVRVILTYRTHVLGL